MKYHSYNLRLQVREGPEADLLRFLREQEENPILPARKRILLALSSFWMPEALENHGSSVRDAAEESILMLLQQAQDIAEHADIDLDAVNIPDVVQRILEKAQAQAGRSSKQTSRRRRQRKEDEREDDRPQETAPLTQATAIRPDHTVKTIPDQANTSPVAQNGTGTGTGTVAGKRKKLF